MKLLRWFVAGLLPGLLGTLAAVPATANELVGFSEDLPPFAYLDGSEHRGLANEVLERIAQRSGLVIKRLNMVWARALKEAQATPNSLLYVTVRTPEREPQYLWVGPIDACDIVLLKLRRRSELQFDPQRISASLQIGALRGAPTAKLLSDSGIPEANIYLTPKSETSVRMLYADRLDLLAGLHAPYAYQAQRHGLDPTELQAIHLLQPGHGCYFAFNPRVDAQLLARFRKGFEELRASGELQSLREQFLRNPGRGPQR